MNRKISGYTLVEVMITLIIVGFLVGMGIFTMFAYMPKQRLLDSLETMEQTLSRAQFEATSRSLWSCIKYTAANKTLTVYMDANADHGINGACGNSNDYIVTTQQIRQGVGFATCVGVGTDTSFDFVAQPLWFDTAGIPKYCNAGSCSARTFQIVVTNADLKSGNKAREVEALSSGLISIVPRGEKGYTDTIFATTASLSGTGQCQ